MHANLGGYGMLARHYICEHLPCQDIAIDTILGFNDRQEIDSRIVDERKQVILLPQCKRLPGIPGRIAALYNSFRCKTAICQLLGTYDVFMGIETMPYLPTLLNLAPKKPPLLLYIQDPRPASEWEDLDTVINTDDGSPRPSPRVQAFYNRLIQQGRLRAISQGGDLIPKARSLYAIPSSFPISVVRNPVQIDADFRLDQQPKEDLVVVLGRLDPVKRPWLALEVAKQMPGVQFCFLGQAHDPVSPYIIYPYKSLPNVHLLGHQSGTTKKELLKKAKFLLNTSIHEAIPVSFLEALSYGTLLISCQNADSLTSNYGSFTGAVRGDGRDQAGLFVRAIDSLLHDERKRRELAGRACNYIREYHDLDCWVSTMRNLIRETAQGNACE